MIFIDGIPFSTLSSSTSQPQEQGMDILIALLESPSLVSASSSLKANPERKFSASEESSPERSKCVYIFQREYATVDPAIVDFVGTDEATTCVGIVIRNQKTGMTSVAHMDSPKIVEMGLSQMLALLLDDSLDTVLDVHLIGGFEDVSLQHANGSNSVSESQADLDGYSFPLCSKIIHALGSREEKFHVRTMCVLGHNTRRDSDGKTYPFFNGFVVETATGVVIPASFDRSTRCPDEIVRRIRVSASYEDTSWNGKLLETYDSSTDCFKIAPCRWTLRQYHIALSLQNYSDSELLSICSTSPTAEGPDFVDNLKRQWNYMIEHPYWTETFPKRQPRVFARSADGRTQIDYILGKTPRKMNYIVGFGNHYPKHVHHRGASIPKNKVKYSCKGGWKWRDTSKPNPNTLVGAMVAGPDKHDGFHDVRMNYNYTEPTLAGNAGLVAALVALSGDKSIPIDKNTLFSAVPPMFPTPPPPPAP